MEMMQTAKATFEAFRDLFNADLLRVRKGRKSLRTFETVTSSVNLTAALQEAFDADPLAGYVALGANVRPLTADETKAIAESTEAEGQGLLPCGEPAQTELFYQSPIRVTEDDVTGAAFTSEVRRFVRSMQAVAQMEGETLFVRYQANVTARFMRNDKDARRARYGGRMYASNRSEHRGTLLAIVTPNEKGGTLGLVEWEVPGFDQQPRKAKQAIPVA